MNNELSKAHNEQPSCIGSRLACVVFGLLKYLTVLDRTDEFLLGIVSLLLVFSQSMCSPCSGYLTDKILLLRGT